MTKGLWMIFWGMEEPFGAPWDDPKGHGWYSRGWKSHLGHLEATKELEEIFGAMEGLCWSFWFEQRSIFGGRRIIWGTLE